MNTEYNNTVIEITINKIFIKRDEWHAKCHCPVCNCVQEFDLQYDTSAGDTTVTEFLEAFRSNSLEHGGEWYSDCLKCGTNYRQAVVATPLSVLGKRFK